MIESDEPRIAIHTVDVASTAIVAPGEGASFDETDAVTAAQVKTLRVVRDEPGHIQIEVDGRLEIIPRADRKLSPRLVRRRKR